MQIVPVESLAALEFRTLKEFKELVINNIDVDNSLSETLREIKKKSTIRLIVFIGIFLLLMMTWSLVTLLSSIVVLALIYYVLRQYNLVVEAFMPEKVRILSQIRHEKSKAIDALHTYAIRLAHPASTDSTIYTAVGLEYASYTNELYGQITDILLYATDRKTQKDRIIKLPVSLFISSLELYSATDSDEVDLLSELDHLLDQPTEEQVQGASELLQTMIDLAEFAQERNEQIELTMNE